MEPLAVVESKDSENGLVCGYPKTGRTWLRFMMAHALSDEYSLDLDINLNNVYSVIPNQESETITGQPAFLYEGVIPKIEMTHKPYKEDAFSNTNMVFMTRDPRDILVSHWLHDSLQVKLFESGLSEYVRDPQRGINAFLSHLESWSTHISADQVVSYEGMRKSPERVVTTIFKQLGVQVSNDSIGRAVSKSEISRMRRIEIASGIAGHNYDRSNPEARRVRNGKVGGFVEYLNRDDLTYIDDSISNASESAKLIIATTPYRMSHE